MPVSTTCARLYSEKIGIHSVPTVSSALLLDALLRFLQGIVPFHAAFDGDMKPMRVDIQLITCRVPTFAYCLTAAQ